MVTETENKRYVWEGEGEKEGENRRYFWITERGKDGGEWGLLQGIIGNKDRQRDRL